ncbi:Probable two-component system sensor histidine kinase [Tenacibaculum maritimum]|uniref:tetratricopeptide repeat-containing sensor histidine kinase n=1 Tax=Tenacibaculum maritimum TaxID=107401 RepID=UPI0012E5C36E|nr:tetratricopeptide repeat-containing sensor histidine kinase [Tenacibaculum maritimum]CAA0154732.1 Probable two-component system sensor histidine kinase [Tenacibaculum maritimum]
MKKSPHQDKLCVCSLLFVLFIKVAPLTGQNSLDSINLWIAQAKNDKNRIEFRKTRLQKAYSYTSKITNDSIKADRLIEIAYRHYKLKDSILFFKLNKEAEQLTGKLKSNYLLAFLHWNYSSFYYRNSDYLKAYNHYNTAYQHFEKTKEKRNAGIMLLSMALIKGYYKDYAGSEQLNIKAIKIFKGLNDDLKLYRLYNHLGLLQHDIKEYGKAIEYYHKALGFYKKIDKKSQKKNYIEIYNNMANAYLKMGKYQKALSYYNKELDKNLKLENHARILDNRAYCKLKMGDTAKIINDFKKALNIRAKTDNKAGVLISKIHLSDYYSFSKDTLKALQLAKEANILAKQIKNGRDYLASLQQLANLDRQNAKKYLDRHIQFNDSLISIERRMRNKFTRIEFETDEYIAETKRLEQQRIWIFFTSVSSLLILSLLYFLRVQKVKNEKLRLEAEQQKANEEIYILTLEQQAKLEEEKVKERNRISEELHDGILGKLFGTRFGLGFLNISGDDETLNKHQSLLNELQEIEKEIREVSHKLSDNFDNSEISFTTIIKQLLKDKSLIGNFNYQINFDDAIPWKEINEITKVNIYRITQEAIQNIIKHAKAKNVTLAFSITSQELIIKLSDDGIGFNTKKGRKGIGLKNITSRIQRIHAHLDIHSEINVGTTFSIKIPYLPQS